MGLIPIFAKLLEPLTSFVGIDGSAQCVWMAAMLEIGRLKCQSKVVTDEVLTKAAKNASVGKTHALN